MKQIFAQSVSGLVLALGFVISTVSAHVLVKPNEVGVASFQTFSVSVPVEKDSATTEMRLVMPSDLEEVMPTVKPGWTIDVKKDGDGEEAKVTEITWKGASIPSRQRDDFTFSAKVPADPTTLQWKAYQTYQDGSTVSWDQTPSGGDDATGDKGPYSETKVVNDLNPQTSTASFALGLSVLAILASGWAIYVKK